MAGLLSRLGRKKSVHIWSAVVVAAGSARRMEGIDKVLTTLGELPVLVHTLRVFQQCPDIAEIVVVTREDLMVEVGSICQDFALTKVSKVIKGGKERIHSVQAGLREVREDAELIAIHDGARPLLPPDVLEEVLHRAAQTGAAAPAVAVKDTIKAVRDDGTVAETLDRAALRAVQTPQIFESALLKAALQAAVEGGIPITDDCSAVERLGKRVYLVEGDEENLKITTPVDLILAEAILQAREDRI